MISRKKAHNSKGSISLFLVVLLFIQTLSISVSFAEVSKELLTERISSETLSSEALSPEALPPEALSLETGQPFMIPFSDRLLEIVEDPFALLEHEEAKPDTSSTEIVVAYDRNVFSDLYQTLYSQGSSADTSDASQSLFMNISESYRQITLEDMIQISTKEILANEGIPLKSIDVPAIQPGLELDATDSDSTKGAADALDATGSGSTKGAADADANIFSISKTVKAGLDHDYDHNSDRAADLYSDLLFASVEIANAADIDDAIGALENCEYIAFAEPMVFYHVADGVANVGVAGVDNPVVGMAGAANVGANVGAGVEDHVTNAYADGANVGVADVSGGFDDANADLQWGLSALDAYALWSDPDVQNNIDKVVIAVVDTGIYSGHEDLKDSLVDGYNFVDGNTDTSDLNGHGTHVAGIAGAVSGNGKGIASPAGGARIMPLKAVGNDGIGSSLDIAMGIIYAADHGAHVINLSLGGASESFVLSEAVEYASGKGSLIVAATGNEHNKYSINYPAKDSNVIPVASISKHIDGHFYESSFSNYEPALSDRIIHAPGENIYSTSHLGTDSYISESGTSMSAPYVAGIAAALLAKSKLALDSGQLKDNLYENIITSPRRYLEWQYYTRTDEKDYHILNYYDTLSEGDANSFSNPFSSEKRIVLTLPGLSVNELGNYRISSNPTVNIKTIKGNAYYNTKMRVFSQKVLPNVANTTYIGVGTIQWQDIDFSNGSGEDILNLSGFCVNDIVSIWAEDLYDDTFMPSEKLPIALTNTFFSGKNVKFNVKYSDSGYTPVKTSLTVKYYPYYQKNSTPMIITGSWSRMTLYWNASNKQYEATHRLPHGTYQFYYDDLQEAGFEPYGIIDEKFTIDKNHSSSTPITGRILPICDETVSADEGDKNIDMPGKETSLMLHLDYKATSADVYRVDMFGIIPDAIYAKYDNGTIISYYFNEGFTNEADTYTHVTPDISSLIIISSDLAKESTKSVKLASSYLLDIIYQIPQEGINYLYPILTDRDGSCSIYRPAKTSGSAALVVDSFPINLEYYFIGSGADHYANYGAYNAENGMMPYGSSLSNLGEQDISVPLHISPISISTIDPSNEDAGENDAAMELNTEKTGMIQYCGDTDSYIFQCSTKGEYTISFTAETPCSLFVYNPNDEIASIFKTYPDSSASHIHKSNFQSTFEKGEHILLIVPSYNDYPGLFSNTFYGGNYSLTIKPPESKKGSFSGAVYAPDESNLDMEELIYRHIPFTDISGHWAEMQIMRMFQLGITSGYEELFNPERKVTRAEYLAMLMRALNLKRPLGEEASNQESETSHSEQIFSDVGENAWYHEAVSYGYALGIVKGNGQGQFFPNETISREEMAVMVYNTMVYYFNDDTWLDENQTLNQTADNKFTDSARISSWAVQAVDTTVYYEIFRGYPDNTYRPKDLATRAEAIATIDSFYTLLDNENGE